MKQMSLATGFEKKSKRTRKREFLDEMDLVVPWHELVTLIESHSPPKATGRPAFAVESMLRIHLLQQWFNLSDPAVEEALYDTPSSPALPGSIRAPMRALSCGSVASWKLTSWACRSWRWSTPS